MLMTANDIERIVLEVMGAHGCHTAVLYGSWARGSATIESDIDVVCVREVGEAVRDARRIDGVYLDAFIYPESALLDPEPALLRILGGKVVRERDGFGQALLSRLQQLHDGGPPPMRDDERRAVVLWSAKMLERIGSQCGIEANYRRMQLLVQATEDYFALRGTWFRGPKEAFAWLAQHDPQTHQRLELAMRPEASYPAYVEVVRAVYGSPGELSLEHQRRCGV